MNVFWGDFGGWQVAKAGRWAVVFRSLFVLSEVYLLEVYLLSGWDLHLMFLEVLLSVHLQHFPLFCCSLFITLYVCSDRAVRGVIFLWLHQLERLFCPFTCLQFIGVENIFFFLIAKISLLSPPPQHSLVLFLRCFSVTFFDFFVLAAWDSFSLKLILCLIRN